MRRPIKWLLVTVAVVLAVGGITFGAFGVVVARVPEYRVQLQDWLNEHTGLIVEFRTLKARLRIFGPELVFDEAIVRTPDRTRVIATAKRGSVGFDLWTSISTGRLTAGRFTLESPEIGLIRTREGRIQLVGQSALPDRSAPFAIEKLPTGRFRVENAVVSFRDEITGRGPWSLSGISFELNRGSKSMSLSGDASLPQALGGTLRFTGKVDGALELADEVASKFTIGGSELHLSGWSDMLPDEWRTPQAGVGSMNVALELQGPTLTRISAKVDFRDVSTVAPQWTTPLPQAAPLEQPREEDDASGRATQATDATGAVSDESPVRATPEGPHTLAFDRLAFVFNASRQPDGWHAALTKLDASSSGVEWRSKRITGNWARDASGHTSFAAEADRIVLDVAWPMLAYLPESDRLGAVRALAARGTVSDVTVEFERASDEAPPEYDMKATFSGLNLAPVARTPGIAGLSGEIAGTQEGGQLKLDSRDARFELPRLFRSPLSARVASGTVNWRREPQSWHVSSERFNVENDDGRVQARFDLSVPDDGSSPVIDLSATASDLAVDAKSTYMPAGRMRPKLLAWLDAAIVGGRVPSAELTLQGPVRAFPFRENEGLFLARGQLEKVTFAYQPGWTSATDVSGELEFRNTAMFVRARQAMVGGVRVADATARIADFRQGQLGIRAQTRGDLQQALRFLRDSPLGPKLGGQFARLEGTGRVDGVLNLSLPLKRLSERNIVVTVHLSDANVSMRGLDAPATHVSGSLTVRNTLIAEADLEGDWLGGPAKATIRPEGPTSSKLTAEGYAHAAVLQPLLRLPGQVRLDGSARWSTSTTLRSGDPSESATRTVTIESDLAGFGARPAGAAGQSRRRVARPQDRSRVSAHGAAGCTRLARSRACSHALRERRVRVAARSRWGARRRRYAFVAESSRLTHRRNDQSVRARSVARIARIERQRRRKIIGLPALGQRHGG